MNKSPLTPLKKQQILELYFCSNDKRLNSISKITGSSDNTVSSVIQEKLDKKLTFERGDYKIFHSKINDYE